MRTRPNQKAGMQQPHFSSPWRATPPIEALFQRADRQEEIEAMSYLLSSSVGIAGSAAKAITPPATSSRTHSLTTGAKEV